MKDLIDSMRNRAINIREYGSCSVELTAALLDEAADALEAQQWIPAYDPPKEKGWYLVTGKGWGIPVEVHWFDGHRWSAGEAGDSLTHWKDPTTGNPNF